MTGTRKNIVVICGCMALILIAGCRTLKKKEIAQHQDGSKAIVDIDLAVSGNNELHGDKDSASGTTKIDKVDRTAPFVNLIEFVQEYQKAKSNIIVSFLEKLKTENPDKLILHAEQIRTSNDIIVLVYDEERKYAPSVPVYVFNNNYFPDGQSTYYRNVTPKTLLPLDTLVPGVYMGVFRQGEVVHGTGILVEYHTDLTTLSNPDLTTEFRLAFH